MKTKLGDKIFNIGVEISRLKDDIVKVNKENKAQNTELKTHMSLITKNTEVN